MWGSHFLGKPKGYVNVLEEFKERRDLRKKFQLGSIILKTQTTYRKMTKMIDDPDQVWPKNPQF